MWLAAHCGPGPARDIHLKRLQREGPGAVAAVQRQLVRGVGEVWANGYAPSDLLHLLPRIGSRRHGDVTAWAILSDPVARDHAGRATGWADQLQVIADGNTAARPDLGELDIAIGVLGQLWLLIDVPPVLPTPGDGTALADSGLDTKVLTRVRAMLRKAESTDFDEEAEALTAKAQELITRHAIDQARLHTDDTPRVRPGVRRIYLDDPYLDTKALLVTEVADANRCRAVYSSQAGWCTVFGFDAYLDATELLVASLLAQALRAQARHGSVRDVCGRSRTRSFRRSFLHAFAVRIGERLRTAAADVMDQTADRDAVLPVLLSRDAQVRSAVEEAFPEMVEKTVGAGRNAAGWMAGVAAADLASLDTTAGALQEAG